MSPSAPMQVHIRSLIDPLLTGAAVLQRPPAGFEPQGGDADCPGCDPNEIPRTTNELAELISYTYDLTVTRAGELNIPVVGSVSGAFDRRVVVYEWTRFKEIAGGNQIRCRYGYVIRFCLTVSKWNAQARVSLPFLSAQAELGNIQASWLMQIRGLVGPRIDAVVLPPQELRVETFVIAKQSLEGVIAAVSDPTTQFRSGIMLGRIDGTLPDVWYWRSAVRTFALESVRRGRPRADAISRLGSTESADHDLVTEAYIHFGVEDPGTRPSDAVREHAGRVLRGMRVDW